MNEGLSAGSLAQATAHSTPVCSGSKLNPQSPTSTLDLTYSRISQVSKRSTLNAQTPLQDTFTTLDTFFRLLLRRMLLHWRTVSWATRSRSGYQRSTTQCRYWLHTDSAHPRRPSRHAQFYSELVPAMIPVALLGSAVYMVRSSLAAQDFFQSEILCRAYTCSKHIFHMKNISTRRARASRNLNRRLMLWY